ncbi:MAG TPA: hypothetical protein VJN89_20125 [Candidatus Acidoferrum sp.]|nr:hypothetical protein [Candidatus Acidoferrum sp.]
MTIVVTAVISVVAKEFLAWVVSLTRTMAARASIKKKLERVFSKKNRTIILDLFVILFALWTLIRDIRNPRPFVRMDILWVILDLTCLSMYTIFFLIHVYLPRLAGTITVEFGDDDKHSGSK